MIGLDPMHARIVKKEFHDRAKAGMTLFLSTHQLSVAEEIADRIGIIHHGKLIALGSVSELRARSHESGALEKVFLSLIDQEEAMREKLERAAPGSDRTVRRKPSAPKSGERTRRAPMDFAQNYLRSSSVPKLRVWHWQSAGKLRFAGGVW